MGLLEVHQLCSQRKFCWVKVIVTDRLSLKADTLLSLVIFFCGICRWFSKSFHSDTCVIQSPCFCSCSRHLTSPHVELERISSIHADRRINHVVVGVDILCGTDYRRSKPTLSTSPSPVLTEVLTRCIYQSDCAAAAVVLSPEWVWRPVWFSWGRPALRYILALAVHWATNDSEKIYLQGSSLSVMCGERLRCNPAEIQMLMNWTEEFIFNCLTSHHPWEKLCDDELSAHQAAASLHCVWLRPLLF